ncbi:MAG: PSD1 and planctomycete cytochrome C domain-containing protein, partial [Rhodopirellula sp. JB053]
MNYRTWIVLFALATLTFPMQRLQSAEIDFENDVLPILEDNCLFCHGEDEQESGLRLDRRGYMLRGGDSGLAAVVPNQPEKSYLIEVINHVDEDMAMPPDEDKLAAEDIATLTQWIETGAVWPGQMEDVVEEELDHWAFLPRQTEFDHASIDAFLNSRLRDATLSFSPPADAWSLIRRVSIVLTGLAPTPERTLEFQRDFAKDPDAAYEELVDELLASPHFGERWAQHWLDVIRWAETNGSESNLYRKNAWMYRDYVVRSFNEDKPYDDFVREQIAGDALGHGDATGFLVSGPHVPAATVGQEPTAIRQARADRMDEILQTVGASMMGVTIGCARCHNHKFDPISIQDYYSMSAAFQDVEFGSRFPELSADHPRVRRAAELRERLAELRNKMRSKGWAWVEDWTGYEEIHFPPKTINEMRIDFHGRWVMMDEMEVLESGTDHRNVLAPEFGATIRDNPSTRVASQPTSNLNNGVFGTKGWRGVSKKGNKEKPWLELSFPETISVETIRMSSNREDFLETDYLEGINKSKYGDFTIALRDDSGQWRPFASTAAMRQKSTGNGEREALQTEIQELIAALQIEGPQPAFLAQFIDPVETFVLARGSPESPRDLVHAAAPKRLSGELGIEPDRPGPERREAFADWLVSPDNPLTARVMANRIWHHLFGSGFVATPSDFGRAGATPTHPQLLDWLTGQFIESGWSTKSTIRMIVLSKAFRQSSAPDDEGLAKDAGAQLLWRFPPRRVEAEVIRDSVLQASGRLDRTIGGPSYRIHNVKKRYAQWEVVNNYGDQTWRRMLYQERMRRVDDRIFTAFDFPDCGQIRAKRPVSTTPLQALNLMNSDFVVRQSELLAERARSERGRSLEDQVTRCFELLLCRQPTADELDVSM